MLALILNSAITLYCIVIFAWAILSWFKDSNKVARDIYKALDVIVAPYVDIFRRLIKPMGGMDLSPFIALIVLQLVGRFVVGLLL